MSVEDIARAVAAEVAAGRAVDLALLFGSQARGTAREDSDVDIGIVGENDEVAFAAALSARLGAEVDVVRLDQASRSLLAAVLRDGIPVFARRSTSFGSFVSRAMLELDLDRDAWERARDAFLRGVAQSGIGHG